MKAEHVMHVVPAVFDEEQGVLGGAERYAMELARHMADVISTTLLAFGPRGSRTKIGELHVRVLGKPIHVRGQSQNPFSLRLFSALRPATVVHCHQRHVLTSSLAAGFCRLTGRKVFVSDLGGGGWDLSAYVRTDNWYHGHLHLSEYSRRLSGHEEYRRAHVISGGVDAEKFSPGTRDDRQGTVVFVGRLLPHKGVDQLVRAVPSDIPLEIIGSVLDPRYLQDLQKLAEGKQVRFRHDCTDEEIVEAYRRALCVVLPIVYTDMYGGQTQVPELLGQTLLEGMGFFVGRLVPYKGWTSCCVRWRVPICAWSLPVTVQCDPRSSGRSSVWGSTTKSCWWAVLPTATSRFIIRPRTISYCRVTHPPRCSAWSWPRRWLAGGPWCRRPCQLGCARSMRQE